jgi:LuxR family maltose regulon positive regulatory protein
MASRDPAEAAAHARRARDPELAFSLVRAQWLAAVLRGDSEVVEELCAELPAPWSDDPEVLAIRAACLRNAGDAERAAALDRRARGRLSTDTTTDTLELTLSLARLFLIDAGAELAAECDRVRDLLTDLPAARGPLRACALLLLGWTQLRLRAPGAAIPLLREAGAACRAEGLDDLADRANANESFALAFGGDFGHALEGIAARAPDQASARWRRVDGAIERFTAGWIHFWRGAPEAATDAFLMASDQGGGLVSYADLARCWLTNAAVDTGDPRRVEQFLGRLELVPDETIQGLPWPVYKGVARAGSALLDGQPATAVGLLDEVITGDPNLPAANVLAAQLYWACGAQDKALRLTAHLLGPVPAYLRAGALVIEALAARGRGEQHRSHELLESALDASAPDRLVRPFLLRDPDLTAMLLEHAAWGTRHQTLVAGCLTRRTDGGAGRAAEVLTAREREILSHLSTTMNTAEIAAALHISPNTLKTHLKAVYRKLGVSGRRDAVAWSRRDRS